MVKHVLLIVLSALALMACAFYNGYPIINSDTGAYINVGFEHYIPADRPPYYGLFLRLTSLWMSLWLPVFAQCVIAAILIIRLFKIVAGDHAAGTIPYFLVLISASAFSTLPWTLGSLMPDAFTGILLLSCLLYYFDRDNTIRTVGYALLICISSVFHNSHLLILFLTSLIFWSGSKWIQLNIPPKRLRGLFILSVASMLIVAGISLLSGNGFRLSKSSHVFMMGKLAETGILKLYLNRHCEEKNYSLCAYKDDIQGRAWDFIWQDNGPFQKTGGWENSQSEYNQLICDILSQPRYLTLFAFKSATSTLRQTTEITLPEKQTVLDANSSPGNSIKSYFEDEMDEYLSSRQNAGMLYGTFFNHLSFIFLVFSTLIILLFRHRILTPLIIKLYIIAVVFIFINAFITATLANVLDRLQYRVFWVIPVLNAMVLIKAITMKVNLREKS